MAENEKNMDLCELKCTLIDALKTQMSGGVGNVDAEEAGEVVDMIKDFAQTDYYEAKAHYYRTVEKAMEEGKSRGRYGYVRGLDRYMDDRDGMELPEWWEMDHMADTDQFDPRRYRMGYTPNRKMMDDKNEKFGTAYREWDVSRRHYHDSNKSEDKEEMNRHAREHIANTLESIRTIWSSSDPELKKRMKADLTALVGELTV